ncbi:hypothetical protein [Streptomyces aurantiogriseus]|uniref:Uncharacterized protein n=1 Tax=Streptomyces aurantiogriseus TaxID=66870 RepID=A0A918CEA9_9ACTN|nr:hypothetical protein [Streptomyces aurantiogriseus]GGR19276.1 hypothetical protein GCM10010251_39330 [Streptomyces aurantiogriseus]
MTTSDELRPGQSMMWMVSSFFQVDGEPVGALSTQAGRGRQHVLGSTDRVGDEPRLIVDFNEGQPLLSVGGQQVGERHGNTVLLWDQEYRIHRARFRRRLRFTVTAGERAVLRVGETSRPDRTVHTYVTHSDPALDPIAALGLILLEARPDRMSVLHELFGR